MKYLKKYEKSNRNLQVLIDELDLGDDYFRIDDEVYFITVKAQKNFNFDIPNGDEGGAYEGYWIPGGYTKHGTTEAVISNSGSYIHNNNFKVFTNFFGDNNVIKIK